MVALPNFKGLSIDDLEKHLGALNSDKKIERRREGVVFGCLLFDIKLVEDPKLLKSSVEGIDLFCGGLRNSRGVFVKDNN